MTEQGSMLSNKERVDARTGLTPFAVAAAAGLATLAVGAIVQRKSPKKRAERAAQVRSKALQAYRLDHLAGSDAAYRVVGRLQDSEAGTPLGDLCADLYTEFTIERSIVNDVLLATGGSPTSLKRMGAKAAGHAAATLAGGAEGDLALFRTLETLAIGVQGKRLLWRALHESRIDPISVKSFHDLEALALDQWTRIESMRLGLVSRTLDPTFHGAP